MQPDLRQKSPRLGTKCLQGYRVEFDEVDGGSEEEVKIDFPFDNQRRYTCSIMRLNIIYTCVRCGPTTLWYVAVFLSPVVPAVLTRDKTAASRRRTSIDRDGGKST